MKSKTIKGFKGFDKYLKCRDKQYEICKTYEEKNAKICESGMHFCENPLDVFNYYPPIDDNKYAVVEGSGKISKSDDGESSKVSSTNLKIGIELNLKSIIEASVNFILDKSKTLKINSATTGYMAHSATTGNWAHSATTGDWANSATSGKESIAAGLGIENKTKAALGSWIVLSEWVQINEDEWIISCVKTVKVDGEKYFLIHIIL